MIFGDPEKGPRGELARYAYGYSDKRPSLTWWLIFIGMVCYIVWNVVTVAPAQERPSIRVGHGATHYCALRGEKVMRSLKVDRQ